MLIMKDLVFYVVGVGPKMKSAQLGIRIPHGKQLCTIRQRLAKALRLGQAFDTTDSPVRHRLKFMSARLQPLFQQLQLPIQLLLVVCVRHRLFH
jgi:hypothetical protein